MWPHLSPPAGPWGCFRPGLLLAPALPVQASPRRTTAISSPALAEGGAGSCQGTGAGLVLAQTGLRGQGGPSLLRGGCRGWGGSSCSVPEHASQPCSMSHAVSPGPARLLVPPQKRASSRWGNRTGNFIAKIKLQLRDRCGSCCQAAGGSAARAGAATPSRGTRGSLGSAGAVQGGSPCVGAGAGAGWCRALGRAVRARRNPGRMGGRRWGAAEMQGMGPEGDVGGYKTSRTVPRGRGRRVLWPMVELVALSWEVWVCGVSSAHSPRRGRQPLTAGVPRRPHRARGWRCRAGGLPAGPCSFPRLCGAREGVPVSAGAGALRDLVVQLAWVLLKPLAGLLAERVAWARRGQELSAPALRVACPQHLCSHCSCPGTPAPASACLAPAPLLPAAPSLPSSRATPARTPPAPGCPPSRSASQGCYRCGSCAPRCGARRTCSCISWRCW